MGFNPISLLTGGLVDTVVGGLKGLGIIKDPEAELKAKQLMQSQLAQQQTFFLDYFTATVGKNEPWYSPSKLFRPLCSFTLVVFYVYARVTGVEFTTTDQTLLFGVIGFWFGGRTLEKLVGKQ